jgi:hypothetical protein
MVWAALCAAAANAQLGKPLDGRPVTASDLSGKKICWDSGAWDFFIPNGELSNNHDSEPHGQWSIPEQGLVKTCPKAACDPIYHYWQAQVLSDGRIYSHRFNGGHGSITGHSEHWGTVCN